MTSMEPKHNFLVTGASSGFGYAIALEALARGHAVLGTARNIAKAREQAPQFEEHGGKWLRLDVTKEDDRDVVSSVTTEHDIDILVNNAGYGLYGVFEDMSEEEIRAQFETNVFGAIRVIQAVIPHFREKRRGVIINMGSISGLLVTNPSGIMYSASKFAMEGISEGLAMQLAPFNIRTLLVEPSFFRTNWLQGSYATPAKAMTPDYADGPIDAFLKSYPTKHGKQPGDPKKAAQIIVDVATETGAGADEKIRKCFRLPLGNDAVDFGKKHFELLKLNYDTMESLARSADFENHTI